MQLNDHAGESTLGRVREDTLVRVEQFANRVLDVAEELDRQGRFRRVVDQVAGSGTACGANLFEANQAMSAKDFTKTLGIVLKELNETKYWLRLISKRGWIKPERISGLLDEAEELLRVFNAVVVKTRLTLKTAKSGRPR